MDPNRRAGAPQRAQQDDAPTDRFPVVRKKSWFKSATGRVVSAAGAIAIATVTTLLATTIDKQVNREPEAAEPTAALNNTNGIVEVAAEGPGWSLGGTPTEMSGDFLTLTASMRPGASCQIPGEGWVFGQSVDAVEPLRWGATVAEESDWAQRNGGVPASGNYVIVNVQSRTGQPVIIESIGARVIKRSDPVVGTLASPSAQCGGMEPALFEVNLDTGAEAEARPIAGFGYGPGGPVELPPVPLPHRLDDNDPSEQWQIALRTENCDCFVVPFFRYTSNGQSELVDITNRGAPWRVTAIRAAQRATHRADEGWCVPAPGTYGC